MSRVIRRDAIHGVSHPWYGAEATRAALRYALEGGSPQEYLVGMKKKARGVFEAHMARLIRHGKSSISPEGDKRDRKG